jgi:predicted ferric reductase
VGIVIRGVAWSALYFGLAAGPLLAVLLLGSPRHSGAGWDFAVAIGIAALGLLGTLFLLTARFQRAVLPFGVDIIYYFHRWVGVLTLTLALLHAALLLALEPAYWRFPDIARHVTASGGLALAALLLVTVTSLARKRLGIEYDNWRRLHALLAVVAAGATVWHADSANGQFSAPGLHALLLAMAGSWAALVLYVRVLKPLTLRPYRVTEVRAERGNAWTVTVRPEGHAGFTFQTGQFAWLTLRAAPWRMREHPFSIASSAERKGELSFTIKALGDFTATIGDIKAGETAWLEGPYGAFTPDRYPPVPLVLVAGGIGIAPIMSMLRTLAERKDARAVLLVYAYRNLETLTFREELEALAARLNLRTELVLREPPPGSDMEAGVLTAERFGRYLPEACRECHYFVCGPAPLVAVVEQTLRQRGVERQRMHFELFDWV